MKQNNIQKKLKDSDKISFIARIYKINKGNNKYSYFATIRKKEIQKLSLKEKDAILLELNNQLFPTVTRKLNTTKNRFMLGFTIPQNIGKNLSNKTNYSFCFLDRNSNEKGINSKLYLNLQKIVPSKTIRGYPFYQFDLNKGLMFWIYSVRTKHYVLPKSIPIDKNNYNLFEFAGAFFCEGFKARKQNKHRDRFSFSNADPEKIEWFIEVSERLLNISKKEWNVQILFSNSAKNENLIKFWSNVGLSGDKIKLIENKTVLAKEGVCILNIYNSTLAETIHHLMEHLEKESLKSKENALHFFRGLSRGYWGVSRKERSIKFSTENEKNVLFFKKLCGILEIPTRKIYHNRKGIKGYWRANIAISSDILIKLIKLNAVTHGKRKEALYRMVNNYKKKLIILNQKV